MAGPWTRAWRRLRRPDAWGAVRRAVAAAVDGAWAPRAKRWSRESRAAPRPGADPRVAVVTVNFSTTRYLALMLATLSEQEGLGLVERLVVVDNGSRDGGRDFVRALAARVPRAVVVERSRSLGHAAGLRAGIRALRRAERSVAPERRATHLLLCDPDVIWRRPDALTALVGAAVAHDAALAGEVRGHGAAGPDIQASLLLVRRDAYDDPAVPPPVEHGSPTLRLQQAIAARGLTVVDFPANRGGYTLHRGRAGVAAAAHHRGHPYARAVTTEPHYMGVPDGADVWAAAEAAHAGVLEPAGWPVLLDRLAARLADPAG